MSRFALGFYQPIACWRHFVDSMQRGAPAHDKAILDRTSRDGHHLHAGAEYSCLYSSSFELRQCVNVHLVACFPYGYPNNTEILFKLASVLRFLTRSDGATG